MNQKLNMIRQMLAAFVLIAAITGISSCEKYSYTLPVVDETVILKFQADIQPIFNNNCVSCHGALKPPDLRDGKSYASLTKGAFITAPGVSSKLYVKMIGSDHAPRSGDIDKQKILTWINQGALNN
jgi:hypothetical protein